MRITAISCYSGSHGNERPWRLGWRVSCADGGTGDQEPAPPRACERAGVDRRCTPPHTVPHRQIAARWERHPRPWRAARWSEPAASHIARLYWRHRVGKRVEAAICIRRKAAGLWSARDRHCEPRFPVGQD